MNCEKFDKISNMEENTTHFGYKTVLTKEKTSLVSHVFNSVANHYDLMNDLMSFGLHRLWKRFALARMALLPHHQVLDLASGTGDLCLLAAKEVSLGRLVVCDINAHMLQHAKDRLIDRGILHNVEYIQANAEQLPFKEDHFDCISISFGLRNITLKETALKEMYRILKPSGRLVILEFSHPIHKPLSQLYDFYSFNIIPALGKWIAKDEDSYRYLAESIRMHPNQETLKTMLCDMGFNQVDYQNLNGGIVAIHAGFKT